MLPKAADLAQNRPLWRMMSTYGAMQSSSCMPETMTIFMLGKVKDGAEGEGLPGKLLKIGYLFGYLIGAYLAT